MTKIIYFLMILSLTPFHQNLLASDNKFKEECKIDVAFIDSIIISGACDKIDIEISYLFAEEIDSTISYYSTIPSKYSRILRRIQGNYLINCISHKSQEAKLSNIIHISNVLQESEFLDLRGMHLLLKIKYDKVKTYKDLDDLVGQLLDEISLVISKLKLLLPENIVKASDDFINDVEKAKIALDSLFKISK